MRTAGKHSYSGLTLIELLVVIAIISIIVSAIVVASFAAMKGSQIKATRGVMQKIALALTQYKLEHRMYRPTTTGLDSSSSADSTTYALWEALELDGKYFTMPAANKLADVTGPPEAPNPRYKYVDAWKKPLWYQCPPLEYDATSDTWFPEIGDFSRFRIISSGPDLEMGIPKPPDPVDPMDPTNSKNKSWGDNIIVE